MNCPFCGFGFRVLMANAAEIPDIAPIVCEDCGEVALLVDGKPRKMTQPEMAAIKQSEAWRTMIAPAQELISRVKKARSARNN